jgi:hypothetical protein
MKKFLLGLAAMPLLVGPAFAAQPLTNKQMDAVTAGFVAFSTADAQALGKIVTTLSSTVSQVAVVTTTNAAGVATPVTATFGETTLNLMKSLSGAQSASSATNTLPTVSIGLSAPGAALPPPAAAAAGG